MDRQGPSVTVGVEELEWDLQIVLRGKVEETAILFVTEIISD